MPRGSVRRACLRIAISVVLVTCAVNGRLLRGDEADCPPSSSRSDTSNDGKSSAAVSYNRDVRPILSNHCFKCHGPAVQEAELRLDLPARATQPLSSGEVAIVPGDAARSVLLSRVTHDDPSQRMPPTGEARPLSDAQVETLRRWIASGANYEPHWAFVPPARREPPSLADSSWPRNAIDRFILDSLNDAGLQPAGEAARETLIRRLSLDLIGLPPTPEEIRQFVSDSAPDAYERLVERLLASPQFGVRQALPWLDLARYADSDGYPNDGDRVVWPYRDWVVQAFNRDLPYDEFTIQQLAGDLLPDATDEQRIASAFHRHTRINREAGVDPEEFRLEAVIDRVNTTATVWLGATVGCAQCHDHKYDPTTHRDYYRLLAFFNQDAIETTTDEAGRISDVSPRMTWLPPELQSRRTAVTAQLETLAESPERKRLEQELASLAPVDVLVMRRHGERRTTNIFQRGSFLTPGELVDAGTPEFLDALPAAAGRDRLALARWLVDKRNPLTARVAVNRLWAQYFGTGLVETLDDFGAQAPPCSHPELLDWLATELMRNDWHWKPMHRLIVGSATYRQRTDLTAVKQKLDPGNRLLSRGVRLRLPAELVRDHALFVSGKLDLRLGGPSVPADKMGAATEGKSAYRRSIYVRWKRQSLDEMFASFDAPSRDVACTRRTRTNTPLQALALLNNRVFLDASRGLAERAASEGGDHWDQRLDFAWLAVLARQPTPAERSTASKLFERRRAAFLDNPEAAQSLLGSAPNQAGSDTATSNSAAGGNSSDTDLADRAAWVLVANTLFNLDEAITRE